MKRWAKTKTPPLKKKRLFFGWWGDNLEDIDMEQIAYQVITDRIIKKLEEGVIPWKQPWNGGGWPKNLVTGIKYRGINPVILSCMGYAYTQWLTFRQVTALGGTVKKGEKATPVIYWNWTEKEDEGTGKKAKIPFLKYYNVFNVEQCEGIDAHMQKLTENPDAETVPECDRVIKDYLGRETGLVLQRKENRAYYDPVKDIMNMPAFARFVSKEEYHACLYHEAVHSTGARSRLDRGLSKPGSFGSDDYSKEELIAELGAAFLCGVTGIAPKTLDSAASYIESWLTVLKANPKMLVQAGAKAQHAVDYILSGRRVIEEAEELQ